MFRSQATLFIAKEDWQKSRDLHYAQLGLSKDPKETLEPLAEHLERGAHANRLGGDQGCWR